MPVSFVRRVVEAVVDRMVGPVRERVRRIEATVTRLEREVDNIHRSR